MSEKVELKPCPVCHSTKTANEHKDARVYCVGCGLRAWNVERWNDRKPDPLVAQLVEALEKARKQFDWYVLSHMEKQPPDTKKALTNQEYRDMCDAALTAARAAGYGE